ncbi:retrovirus-related pol polyprotein from transposon TNT 1-94 [Tanacetum coccineum]
MDSMVLNGQKNTLVEYMILSGADNRPPMLDKPLYDSWKSRIELYMQNREHRRMILDSVEHGPLEWPSIKVDGVTRLKKYVELSASKKLQADCDLKATNIILQGLPIDVYAFVNHHRITKDLWKQVQLRMQGRNNSGQQRVIKCFNCQGEGHMKRQCPKPKRKRDATWFRDKVLLVKAQGSGKVLNEEELEFLANLEIAKAKAVLMPNLCSYSSYVLSEVPNSENTHNDMLNQSVQEMPYFEQTHLVNYPENEITSDINIIHYSQYLLETQNAAV